jgi:hypothetical protein
LLAADLEVAAMAHRKTDDKQIAEKVRDAKFLVDEFNIAEGAASNLVASEDDELAEEVVGDLHQAQDADDPLKGIPTPSEPPEEFTLDTDEEKLKPVIHERNRRTGAG